MVVEKKKYVEKNLKKEEMAEWFKAADCKFVEFFSSEVQILLSSTKKVRNMTQW